MSAPVSDPTLPASSDCFVTSSCQGLTLVHVTAQLELFCLPYNPTKLMNVSSSCSS